jgi:hypothetical protein
LAVPREGSADLGRALGFELTYVRGSLMEICLPRLPEPIAFRFSAYFNIQIQPEKTSGFTTEQNIPLQTIAGSPITMRRIARMALETELEGITVGHFSDLFEGPSDDQILECVLPCLSPADTTYWERLRDRPGDTLHQEIATVFLAFEVILRRAGLEELSAAVEPIRKTVGIRLEGRNF